MTKKREKVEKKKSKKKKRGLSKKGKGIVCQAFIDLLPERERSGKEAIDFKSIGAVMEGLFPECGFSFFWPPILDFWDPNRSLYPNVEGWKISIEPLTKLALFAYEEMAKISPFFGENDKIFTERMRKDIENLKDQYQRHNCQNDVRDKLRDMLWDFREQAAQVLDDLEAEYPRNKGIVIPLLSSTREALKTIEKEYPCRSVKQKKILDRVNSAFRKFENDYPDNGEEQARIFLLCNGFARENLSNDITPGASDLDITFPLSRHINWSSGDGSVTFLKTVWNDFQNCVNWISTREEKKNELAHMWVERRIWKRRFEFAPLSDSKKHLETVNVQSEETKACEKNTTILTSIPSAQEENNLSTSQDQTKRKSAETKPTSGARPKYTIDPKENNLAHKILARIEAGRSLRETAKDCKISVGRVRYVNDTFGSKAAPPNPLPILKKLSSEA